MTIHVLHHFPRTLTTPQNLLKDHWQPQNQTMDTVKTPQPPWHTSKPSQPPYSPSLNFYKNPFENWNSDERDTERKSHHRKHRTQNLKDHINDKSKQKPINAYFKHQNPKKPQKPRLHRQQTQTNTTEAENPETKTEKSKRKKFRFTQIQWVLRKTIRVFEKKQTESFSVTPTVTGNLSGARLLATTHGELRSSRLERSRSFSL